MLSIACVFSGLPFGNQMRGQNHLRSRFPMSKKPQKVKKSLFSDPREFCRGEMGWNLKIKEKRVQKSKKRSESRGNVIKSDSTSKKNIFKFLLFFWPFSTFFMFFFPDVCMSAREAHQKASKTVKNMSVGHQMMSFACILPGLWCENRMRVQSHLHSRFPKSKKPKNSKNHLFCIFSWYKYVTVSWKALWKALKTVKNRSVWH